jgi:uncharacterized protein (DUF1330 family)
VILIRLSAAFSLTIALVMSSVTAQAEEACDKPVDMVILSIVHDVARYQAYRSSLIELGTLEAFGGLVISVATRLEFEPEILEGDWPFVIRWPCAAAAHAFWNSETYQTKNLPLRVGAGQFNVALFPSLPE